MVEDFFRAGSLVFGGGHVVLPLLQSVVVPGGLVTNDMFLAGYGAAQAMQGINAVVVGLLLSALYNPVWTNAIYNVIDFSVALGAFLLLNFWKWPSWLVVLIGAGIGQVISN